MSDILIGLVQLGFLGFAVAIMYLAYKLLGELVRNPGQDASVLKFKMIAVVSFLALSAGVLVLGIYFSFEDPNREVVITLDMFPDEERMNRVIRFRHKGEAAPWDGQKELAVRNNSHLTVDFLALRDEIRVMEDNLARLKARADGLERQSQGILRSALEAPSAASGAAAAEQGI